MIRWPDDVAMIVLSSAHTLFRCACKLAGILFAAMSAVYDLDLIALGLHTLF